MRRSIAIAAGTIVMMLLSGSSMASAQEAPWEVRVRIVYLDPANNSDAYAPLGIPADAIHVSGRWLPDLDFEYFFTPHLSSELLFTFPQSHTVTVQHSVLGGPVVIGSFKELPPTLTLKYDFLPDGVFQPYLGAGVNLTFISEVNLSVPTAGPVQLDRTSVGPALQAGFDFQLTDNMFLNADLKWAMIRADAKYQGATLTEVRLDPFLFGVGFGYRFGAD